MTSSTVPPTETDVDRHRLQVQQVLDALNCGAALLDRGGVLVHVNPRLCEMMGLQLSQATGRNVREFYSAGTERQFVDTTLQRVDEPREFEFVVPRSDGSRLPVAMSAKPLPPPLEALHVVTVIDISAQKRSESDLREHMRLITQVGDNALEHALDLKGYSEALERKVSERTEDLRLANLDAIYMLAVASEAKDSDTGRHVRRIQKFAELLSRRLGLNESESSEIGLAAVLHDIGKIHIPDEILKKPGPLDDDERFLMRQHTLFGERILSKRSFFDRARRIARSHHENWDGSGYPDGLGGESIPMEARIVRVVDVFDALTQARVYKPAWTRRDAIDFIAKSAGTIFDRHTAAGFCALVDSGEVDALSESIAAAYEV